MTFLRNLFDRLRLALNILFRGESYIFSVYGFDFEIDLDDGRRICVGVSPEGEVTYTEEHPVGDETTLDTPVE